MTSPGWAVIRWSLSGSAKPSGPSPLHAAETSNAIAVVIIPFIFIVFFSLYHQVLHVGLAAEYLEIFTPHSSFFTFDAAKVR